MLENAKQKFVVRHYSENDFKGGGLRGEAEYRDLGVAEATNGRFTAHVARIAPGAVKKPRSDIITTWISTWSTCSKAGLNPNSKGKGYIPCAREAAGCSPRASVTRCWPIRMTWS